MKKIILVFSLIVSFLASGSAWATFADMTYDYTRSGNTYTFKLTVKNTYTENLDYFQINLDADVNLALYANIAWINDKGWTTTAANFDPAFGDLPGAITADDALIFGGHGGIAPNATLTGFTFKFDYSGVLDPTAQTFSYLASFGTHEDPTNANGYATILDESGNIRYFHEDNNNPPVPEPGTIVLLGVGLVGMGLCLRRRGR